MAEFDFLKEYARMLKINKDGDCTIECDECPIKEPSSEKCCVSWVLSHPDEATEIVRKWSEEHPQKTRKDLLFKHFPFVRVDSNGNPDGCIGYFTSESCSKNLSYCDKCRKEYWNEVIDDE